MKNSGILKEELLQGKYSQLLKEIYLDESMLEYQNKRYADAITEFEKLYGEKEVTMDEISLITDSLREKVGRNVNVIWGTGKDETLGDKLRVAVIATGFNNNRGRATAATEQKIETATTTSAKKPYFKVEPLPDDLEMKVMNPAELEEEARLRRQKQEEERARKQKRESNRRVDRFERSQRGVNEVPDTNGWLKRKIGTLFSDEE